MGESRLERLFKNEVEKHGGKALKFISPGMRGVPDRIVLLPGAKVAFVELKAPGEEMRPLQKKRASQLREMGFTVYCIDSIAAIHNFIADEFGV